MDMQTHTDTHRHIQRHSDRDTDTHGHKHTDIQVSTETHKHTRTHTHRSTHTHTHTHTDARRYLDTHTLRHRHTQIGTDTQIDTEKHADTHTETRTHAHGHTRTHMHTRTRMHAHGRAGLVPRAPCCGQQHLLCPPLFIKKIPTLAATPQVSTVVRTTGKTATSPTSPHRASRSTFQDSRSAGSFPGPLQTLYCSESAGLTFRHVLVLFVWVYFCLRSAGSLTDMTG